MPKTCNYLDCPRSVFGRGYCKIHQYLRGIKKSPANHSAKKTINPISKQLRKKIALYTSLRKIFLVENPLCKAQLPNCKHIATDIHHIKGRGRYLNEMDTWLPVCRNCHHRIEMFPKEAKALGLSQSRISDNHRCEDGHYPDINFTP